MMSNRIFRSTLLILTIAMAGCQSMNEFQRRELAWQSLHAVDIAQTMKAAHDPCYVEQAWLTQKLIGEQPSDGEVLAWGIGSAALHYVVSKTLEQTNAPAWIQKVWSYGSISYAGFTVADNYSNGIRLTKDNKYGC
jgi:hypothetical protein